MKLLISPKDGRVCVLEAGEKKECSNCHKALKGLLDSFYEPAQKKLLCRRCMSQLPDSDINIYINILHKKDPRTEGYCIYAIDKFEKEEVDKHESTDGSTE